MTTPWPDEADLPPDRPVVTAHLPEEAEMPYRCDNEELHDSHVVVLRQSFDEIGEDVSGTVCVGLGEPCCPGPRCDCKQPGDDPATPPEIPAAALTPPGGDTTLDGAVEAGASTFGANEWRLGDFTDMAGYREMVADILAAAAPVLATRHAAKLEANWNEGLGLGARNGREQAAQAIEAHSRSLPALCGDDAYHAGLINAAQLARGATPTPATSPPLGRLAEIRALQPGWLDGQGLVPDPDTLDAVEALIRAYGLDVVRFYPTEAGGMTLEWEDGVTSHELVIQGVGDEPATPTPAGGEAESGALASRMIRDELTASPVWPYGVVGAGKYGDWIATKLGCSGLLAEPPRGDLAAYVASLADAARWCEDRAMNVSAGPGCVLAEVRQDLIRIMNTPPPTPAPPAEGPARCGAADDRSDDPADEPYGTCELQRGHAGRHVENRYGGLWAEWAGPNNGPAEEPARCVDLLAATRRRGRDAARKDARDRAEEPAPSEGRLPCCNHVASWHRGNYCLGDLGHCECDEKPEGWSAPTSGKGESRG